MSNKNINLFFSIILIPVDALMLFLAGVSAYLVRTSDFVARLRPVLFFENLPFERYLHLLFIFIPIWILIFALFGMYRVQRPSMLEEFFKIISVVSFAMMGVIFYIFIQVEQFDSRFIILAVWFFSIVYLTTARFLIRKLKNYIMSKSGVGLLNTLIIGDDSTALRLAKRLKENPKFGYRVVQQFSNLDLNYIKKIIDEKKIDAVVVGQSESYKDDITDLAELCQLKRINFKFAPTLFHALASNIEINAISGIPLMELKYTPLDGWGKVIKRIIDIIGSSFGLVILSPFFVIIAILIKLDSEGPVFVRLKRVSQDKEFNLYKFRSMVKDAEKLKAKLLDRNERKDGPLFKIKNDPRVTKFGRVLRRYRIDELPQLFNVLKGEMSLVGPRPHQPDEIARYKDHHKKVLTVKSGMTGMAQVSGSSDLPFEEEVKLDLYYIENWSLFLDLKILLRTLLIIFKDKSAC